MGFFVTFHRPVAIYRRMTAHSSPMLTRAGEVTRGSGVPTVLVRCASPAHVFCVISAVQSPYMILHVLARSWCGMLCFSCCLRPFARQIRTSLCMLDGAEINPLGPTQRLHVAAPDL